jgi:hypothetical protein
MRKVHNISILAVLVVALCAALSAARAQDSSTQPAPGTSPGTVPDSSQEPPSATPSAPPGTPQSVPPAPAYGQSGAAPIAENPPISALDQPALGPHAAPLSYVQLGATVNETADSNVANELGGGGAVKSVSRGLGTFTLRRLWSNFDLALDYAGGVSYYNAKDIGWRDLQQLGFVQKINWKRGQFTIRDDFSYLPEGNFGAAYGSLVSQQQTTLGAGFGQGFLGGNNFGALGNVPRLMNVAAADLSEDLSPKSAFTLAAGYGVVHFYGSDPQLEGVPFVGSSQISAQGGYDRVLTPHDQVALIYGYQAFHFTPGGCTTEPGSGCVGGTAYPGTSFDSQVIELAYAHRISGRLDFTIAAGPQIIYLSECTAEFGLCLPDTTYADTRLGVAGRAMVRYRFPRTSLEMSYVRMTTAGSGFFAGAQSDIARLQVNRPLTRKWTGFVDLGYTRNSRIEPEAFGAINANIYTYGFAGVGVHRMLGRNFHAFASYQFNELSFDDSICTPGVACNRISQRQLGTIGLDWIPRPIRID